MAWFRATGGGSDYKKTTKYVKVVTNSTGGTTAAVNLEYYENGVKLDTVIKTYNAVNGRANAYDYKNIVKLYYLGSSTSWVIEALCDVVYDDTVCEHGDTITSWLYSVTVDYEIDKVLPIKYGNYVTDYFPCLLDNTYYTIFSKASNDEIYNGGRGGTRSSSNPVFYFCCKTTTGYWGYGLIGLASASVQITSTTSYGGAEYYTQTTTNGDTVYLARLGAMNSGQTNDIFKNGYFEIDIDGSQYVEQNDSTYLFDQTFVDAAYEALTALS